MADFRSHSGICRQLVRSNEAPALFRICTIPSKLEGPRRGMTSAASALSPDSAPVATAAECTEALDRALETIDDDPDLNDISIHLLRLIAEFVPYREWYNKPLRGWV